MKLLDKTLKLASHFAAAERYDVAADLYRVATDLAFVETNEHFKDQFVDAYHYLKKLKADLEALRLYAKADQIDVIARDIESRVIDFTFNDPIESVLTSYKTLHRIAQATEASQVKEVLEFVNKNEDNMSDYELLKNVDKMTLGINDNDKRSIYYILHKDYGLLIPQQKYAQMEQVDALSGGKADKKKLEDYSKEELVQLIKGIGIEREHSDEPEKMLEISEDHLEEDKKYYDHLIEMEKKYASKPDNEFLDEVKQHLKDKPKEMIVDPKTSELKKKMDEHKKHPKKDDGKEKPHDVPVSLPSTPYMWGGFSYQNIVPYQQSSQLNFWSIAAKKQRLSKIAKK